MAPCPQEKTAAYRYRLEPQSPVQHLVNWYPDTLIFFCKRSHSGWRLVPKIGDDDPVRRLGPLRSGALQVLRVDYTWSAFSRRVWRGILPTKWKEPPCRWPWLGRSFHSGAVVF